MNWKGCERKRPWPNLRYYVGIFLEGLRRIMNNLRQGSQYPGLDLKSGPLKNEARVLTTRP
jgi:hypothetical protein